MIQFVISLIENSDQRKFVAALYRKYKEDMFRYACSIVHDIDLAEDAVSQAFVGIIKNLKTVLPLKNNKQKTYIFICVKNASYNFVKKQARFSECEVSLEFCNVSGFNENMEDHVIRKEYSEELYNIVKTLPDRYRDVVLLRYYVELSYKQISSTLNISVQQVGVILNRAKVKLKDKVEK